MATPEIKSNVSLDIKINLQLDIDEAMALGQIIGYGTKSFLEVFYKHLGQAYLKPHEKGLIKLFNTLQYSLPYRLKDVETIIETANKLKN